MASYDDIRARASRPTTVVQLCLDGAALGEVQALERQLAAAPAPTSLGEQSLVSQLAEQITAVQDRAAASMVDIHLRAVPGRLWGPLWSRRPIRAADEDEASHAARWYDWVCELVSACAVDPAMTPGQVADLADDLPAASWDQLTEAAWELCTQRVSVPKSAVVSALTQPSAGR